MRQVVSALIAVACLAIFMADRVSAQPTPPVSVGFRNQTGTSVIVQGYTIVNGSIRRGTPILVNKNGGIAFDSNVPAGVRFYTIHDANQATTRILLRDHRVAIQNRDAFFAIVPMPNNPNQVLLVPDP
jgi:hypothetical protein